MFSHIHVHLQNAIMCVTHFIKPVSKDCSSPSSLGMGKTSDMQIEVSFYTLKMLIYP